jgi:hypothetical protein
MRRIEQPGAPVPERIQWVEARGLLDLNSKQTG